MLGRDPKTGLVKLRPESLDDLWHLYNLVERGDLAEAVTMRRTEARLDKDREGRTDKKPMLIAVRVETVEFHDFANRLRVFGTIERGPQEHGAHHTLNVEPLDEIAIVKPVWKPHHEERIREAVEASLKPRVVFVAIEEGEAVVAVLRHYGVHRAAELYGPKRGKQFAGREADRTDFFEEIALAVGQARGDDAPLLVVGPGFVKEELVAWGKERHPETFRGATIEGTGQAGLAGVQEAIRRGMVDRIQKDARVVQETQLVEELLSRIAASGTAAYGPREALAAIEAGAAQTVLVTDELVRRGEGEAFLVAAKSSDARSFVVSTSHEAGAKLASLGGVGVLLRYQIV